MTLKINLENPECCFGCPYYTFGEHTKMKDYCKNYGEVLDIADDKKPVRSPLRIEKCINENGV